MRNAGPGSAGGLDLLSLIQNSDSNSVSARSCRALFLPGPTGNARAVMSLQQ
jgi:hypothetical protein